MTETRLEKRVPRALAAFAVVAAIAASGFSASGAQTAAVQPGAAPTAATPAGAAAVSVRDLMVGMVAHAANELWSVEQDGRAPKTDEQWRNIEHHAIQLTASGTLTALGGSGQADRAWASRPEWKQYSQQMTDVGLAALEAARRKDLDALITVNGRIGDVCQTCHQAMMR